MGGGGSFIVSGDVFEGEAVKGEVGSVLFERFGGRGKFRKGGKWRQRGGGGVKEFFKGRGEILVLRQGLVWLHEWRNDGHAVSTRDSVKLKSL